MSKAVTSQEFTELKDWMISHFTTKEDLAVVKHDVAEFKNETITRFDKIFGMLEALNQERLFMHAAIIRIEEKLSK